MRHVVLVAASAVLLAAACGRPAPKPTFVGGTFQRGPERFRVVSPPPPWERVVQPAGDVAWYDPRTHAIIAANATCRGHQDPPLEVLLNDLLIGTTKRRYLLEETLPLDGREAKHAVVALELDGVPLVYDVYVYKKDGCVYDLALVVSAEAYEQVADFYVGFVANFRGLGGGA